MYVPLILNNTPYTLYKKFSAHWKIYNTITNIQTNSGSHEKNLIN